MLKSRTFQNLVSSTPIMPLVQRTKSRIPRGHAKHPSVDRFRLRGACNSHISSIVVKQEARLSHLRKPGTSLCPNNLCINLLCLACLSKRFMTRRCCCEIRGVSHPVERVATTRLGLGSMLAVEEERRDSAGRG